MSLRLGDDSAPSLHEDYEIDSSQADFITSSNEVGIDTYIYAIRPGMRK